MREIKFRWWNVNNERRLYGDLFRNRRQRIITQDGVVSNPLAEPEDWEVDPETVGQFTWLFDKDGKEIYEGDILWSNHLWEMHVEWTIAYDEDLARIVFLQTNWAFEEINKANLNLLEVVGNIYENPELFDQ